MDPTFVGRWTRDSHLGPTRRPRGWEVQRFVSPVSEWCRTHRSATGRRDRRRARGTSTAGSQRDFCAPTPSRPGASPQERRGPTPGSTLPVSVCAVVTDDGPEDYEVAGEVKGDVDTPCVPTDLLWDPNPRDHDGRGDSIHRRVSAARGRTRRVRAPSTTRTRRGLTFPPVPFDSPPTRGQSDSGDDSEGRPERVGPRGIRVPLDLRHQ